MFLFHLYSLVMSTQDADYAVACYYCTVESCGTKRDAMLLRSSKELLQSQCHLKVIPLQLLEWTVI